MEPWYFSLDSAITTRPHIAVVEMLLQEQRCLQKMGAMVREVATIMDDCTTEASRPVHILRTGVQLPPRRGPPPLLSYWIARSESIFIDAIHPPLRRQSLFNWFSCLKITKSWKVRAEPSLLLTGPCALGLALNRALGNEPLARF